MSYTRFALYYVPYDGPLAAFGAHWLGWDVNRGQEVPQPDLQDMADITRTPRKYGFHATLKPPFHLAQGHSITALRNTVSGLAARLAAAQCDGLELATFGRFLALAPVGDASAFCKVAAACVRELDVFRAPPSEAEVLRRRRPHLSKRQNALLTRWGYPHVMEEYRFHMTLTGRLPKEDIAGWLAAVQRYLPDLPRPFTLDRIALCAERPDGRFEVIQSDTLTG